MTAAKRNRQSLEDYFTVIKWITDQDVKPEHYTAVDLIAFIERNTKISMSVNQLRRAFKGAGLEWNVIGAKGVEKEGRATLKSRVEALEGAFAALEKDFLEFKALMARTEFTVPKATLGPLPELRPGEVFYEEEGEPRD